MDWSQGNGTDTLIWIGNSKEFFCVKDCYMVTNIHRFDVGAEKVWKKIWEEKMHERLKMHLWRMMANMIPTINLIYNRINKGEECCFLCDADVENSLHIFS